jgi:hypothetical protein
VVVYVVLRLPGLSVPLDRDEGAFGYIGQIINRGWLPYRDALDHKPPVAFYINSLALHLVPPTAQGIHWFLLFYNFLTLICVFFLARVYFRSLSTGLWCAFAYAVFSASPAIQGFTASTEMWALLPITLSLLLAVLAAKKTYYLLIFLSGATGAAACWTKQTAFASIVLVALIVGLVASRQRKFWGPVVWLGGAIAFSCIPIFYFYGKGIFKEFLYWCFEYGAIYAGQAPFGEIMSELGAMGLEILKGDFVIVGPAIIVAVWCAIHRKQWFPLGFLALSFAGTIPGYAYRHYFAQVAPAVALAAGVGFSMFVSRARTHELRLTATILCGLMMVSVPLLANGKYFFERDPNVISRIYFGLNPFPEAKALGDFIAQKTLPDDRILIVGSEPEILFYARRASASPFLMTYPLLTTHPRYREFQEQMWSQAQRAKAKYAVAVLHLPFSMGWDRSASTDILDNFQSLLSQHYDLERVMGISDSEGTWIDPDDPRLQSGDPFVYVFRRRN